MPKTGRGFNAEMDYYDDNLDSLTTRIARLHTEQAWAEQPSSRTRHLLTNTLVEARGPDEWLASSNFLLTRARADHAPDLFPGQRHDTLVREHAGLLLKKRVILLDHTVLKSYNLSFLF